jgi:hypothetical protein
MVRVPALSLLAVLCLPSLASAQAFNTRWGVQASFAPNWKIPDVAKDFLDAESLDVQGREFRVGIVRGRTLGGDWGVTFVQKTIKDESFIETADVRRTASEVVIRGAAIEKFGVFGTIKERVQIGMIAGIGAATASGRVTERDLSTGVQTEIEANHFIQPFGQELPFVPLARLELAVAIIAAPGFKLRASGGFNYPGIAAITIGGVFLFGER